MRYAQASSEVELPSQPPPQRAGKFALFVLFFAVHFAIVACLTLLVLREMSAAADPAQLSLSREYPMAWSGTVHAWSALSTPTQWLDSIARATDTRLYRWQESTRILFQCGFCGLVWGLVTFLLYLLGRRIVFEAKKAEATPIAPPPPTPVESPVPLTPN